MLGDRDRQTFTNPPPLDEEDSWYLTTRLLLNLSGRPLLPNLLIVNPMAFAPLGIVQRTVAIFISDTINNREVLDIDDESSSDSLPSLEYPESLPDLDYQ